MGFFPQIGIVEKCTSLYENDVIDSLITSWHMKGKHANPT